jgi:dipeptidyl aminopeptidase/acylaminoacyl peptidase
MRVKIIALMFLFTAAFVLSGLCVAKGLTPEDIAKIRTVTSVAMSPDGSHIAYTLNVPRPLGEEDGGAWRELHVVEVASGDSLPFVTGKVNVSGVKWLPDGKRISYLAKRNKDEHTALYVIPVDGGESKRVVSLKSSILSYGWCPGGQHAAVIASEPEAKEVKTAKKKGFTQEIYEEDWSPRRLYLVDPDGEEKEDLEPLPVEGSVFSVVFNPKGERVVASVAPTPLVDDSYMRQQVKVVDNHTGDVLAEFENPGKLGEFVWSPDGTQVAMISGVDINDPAEGRILVGSATGGALTDPLNNHKGHISQIEWAADALHYINDEGVWTHFEAVLPDGKAREVIINGEGSTVLTDLSVAKDGKAAAFVGSSPNHPNEVFYWSEGLKKAKRMTDSNPSLPDFELAAQEVVTFKARDGLELEGVLIRPLNELSGQRYPLVLVVHGGPEAHHLNGWLTSYSNLGQMAAAKGIATFYTNYRGSTGRGVEFSKLSQGDPAGKEFDDLVDAVDHLVEVGLVDPKRVGITGGSYGGYATGWGATRYSDRFAAGVMFVGISDKVSKVGTTDIPDEEFYVHALSRPWDDWSKFLKASPIYYADQGKTPLLILHGKADPRVNVGQSRELYRHLKLRGKAPVRLVLYPGEGHGNRRAASRYDYSLRAMRWFEHFLLKGGTEAPEYEIDYGEIVKEKKGDK